MYFLMSGCARMGAVRLTQDIVDFGSARHREIALAPPCRIECGRCRVAGAEFSLSARAARFPGICSGLLTA